MQRFEKWLCNAVFQASKELAQALPYTKQRLQSLNRRTAMKFETLMLHSLFAACLLVCVLTFGSMLTSKAPAVHVAAAHAPVAASVHSAS
jgi:hypothetical protein